MKVEVNRMKLEEYQARRGYLREKSWRLTKRLVLVGLLLIQLRRPAASGCYFDALACFQIVGPSFFCYLRPVQLAAGHQTVWPAWIVLFRI